MCMANLANVVSSDVDLTMRHSEAFPAFEAGQLAKLRQDDNDMAKIQSKCRPRQQTSLLSIGGNTRNTTNRSPMFAHRIA